MWRIAYSKIEFESKRAIESKVLAAAVGFNSLLRVNK